MYVLVNICSYFLWYLHGVELSLRVKQWHCKKFPREVLKVLPKWRHSSFH